jgi:hypothetical protein
MRYLAVLFLVAIDFELYLIIHLIQDISLNI